ncbi:MAG: tetratricopeptide repeat protein [Deltaproteobacteria bacterium]|nr:tetratricopeptide repeat protein [Deltaproteobacteria bacterium]
MGRALVLGCLIMAGSAVAGAQRPVARALAEDGERAVRAGHLRQAAGLFERALAADLDYLPTYRSAVPVWLQLGELQRAVRHLERLTLRHPGHVEGWYALALTYRQADQFARAVMAYDVYLSMRPRDADPYFGLGIALGQLGRHPAAEQAFSRYVELAGDDNPEFVREARRRRLLHRLHQLLPAAYTRGWLRSVVALAELL